MKERTIPELSVSKGASFLKDRKVLLSTLWIFVVLNYLYCDVVSLMDSSLLKQYLTGTVGGMELTQGFLLVASLLMEVSVSMVLLSRLLPYRGSRWANLVAGAITTGAQSASLLAGEPSMYYLFFSVIEIACTLGIFIIALRWTKKSEQTLNSKGN